MEAGLTINVIQIELCGGKQEDEFPSMLINQYGEVFATNKMYYVTIKGKQGETLRDKSGREYVIDAEGRVKQRQEPAAQQGQTEENAQIF